MHRMCAQSYHQALSGTIIATTKQCSCSLSGLATPILPIGGGRRQSMGWCFVCILNMLQILALWGAPICSMLQSRLVLGHPGSRSVQCSRVTPGSRNTLLNATLSGTVFDQQSWKDLWRQQRHIWSTTFKTSLRTTKWRTCSAVSNMCDGLRGQCNFVTLALTPFWQRCFVLTAIELMGCGVIYLMLTKTSFAFLEMWF